VIHCKVEGFTDISRKGGVKKLVVFLLIYFPSTVPLSLQAHTACEVLSSVTASVSTAKDFLEKA
jgi:hypothetical protein